MSSVQELLQLKNQPDKLVSSLKAADLDTLYSVMSQSGMTGQIGAEYEAVRDTAAAVLQARLTDKLVGTMERLNKSATILYWVGIGVAIVVGVAEVVVPLIVKR